MNNIILRKPTIEDSELFIFAMLKSQELHTPWVKAPLTSSEFAEYLHRYEQPNQESFLVCNDKNKIVGVFNINEIIHRFFQNAYLSYYVVAEFAGKGYMSAGLKLVLQKVFNELKLHRVEANIQPDNLQSIFLVKNNGFRYEGFSPRYLKINDKWCGHEHWAMTYEDFIKDDADIIEKDCIDIVPYDPAWPTQANFEIDKLKTVLPPSSIIDIQHVGSTAIPGIAAKPIIDIQIAVRSLEEMKIISVPVLQKLGYEYWENNPDTQRMFFAKGMPPFGEKRSHHVHIVELTSKHWKDKINFRDYLIAHPDVANAYQALKLNLAQQYRSDRERYTTAKSEFINNILILIGKSD